MVVVVVVAVDVVVVDDSAVALCSVRWSETDGSSVVAMMESSFFFTVSGRSFLVAASITVSDIPRLGFPGRGVMGSTVVMGVVVLVVVLVVGDNHFIMEVWVGVGVSALDRVVVAVVVAVVVVFWWCGVVAWLVGDAKFKTRVVVVSLDGIGSDTSMIVTSRLDVDRIEDDVVVIVAILRGGMFVFVATDVIAL